MQRVLLIILKSRKIVNKVFCQHTHYGYGLWHYLRTPSKSGLEPQVYRQYYCHGNTIIIGGGNFGYFLG